MKGNHWLGAVIGSVPATRGRSSPCHRRSRKAALLLVGLLSPWGAHAGTVMYTVRVDTSAEPFFEVEARFPYDGKGPLQVSLPASRPGSPRLWNFSRLVSRVEATIAGTRLPVRRSDPLTWQVEPGRRGVVTFRYRAYVDRSDDLRLGSSWIDAEGAYADGAAVFLLSPQHRRAPARVQVIAPSGWKVATTLDPDSPGSFHASSYDRLVDAPIMLGPALSERFVQAECARFRFVFDRPLPPYDAARLDENLRRIADAETHLFGSCPFRSYTVFVRWRPDLQYGGGLEHADSVTLNVGREWMQDLPAEAAGTLAHELFHAWNGEAIKPACQVPWDYRRANPCPELWFVEGVTSYYASVILVRAGIWSEEKFLRFVAKEIECWDAPLRDCTSLEDAAVAEWSHPIENLDYYCGGALVGFLLDLEMRARTRNARSLDDAMRVLYAGSRAAGYGGYGERDLVNAVEGRSGVSVAQLFERWVRRSGRWEPTVQLHEAGLQLVMALDPNGTPRVTLSKSAQAEPASRRVLEEITRRDPRLAAGNGSSLVE